MNSNKTHSCNQQSPLEISNNVYVQNYESIIIKSIKILHKKNIYIQLSELTRENPV